ncbi:MAG: response regulator [Deltaproteobacteria bacterium]|nr:response regulator [Deltaproteobacteria bacterium]
MKCLRKMSISGRLILVMSLIAILTAGLSAYLILRFIDSGEQVKILAEEGTRGIIWGEKANFHLHNLIINFYRANSGDMKWVRAMEENIPRIRAALDEYAKTANDPRNKELLAETYQALEIYANDIVILGQSFRQGIFGPDIIRVLNDLETKPHANRLIADINNLVEYSKTMAEKNRASFFADMAANTRASILLACVVILILVGAGYLGVVWTRDEIAERDAKEHLLRKLQADLQNSLRAAGAISRQFSFETGELQYAGDVEQVLGRDRRTISSFTDYLNHVHPEDLQAFFGDFPWEEISRWEEFAAHLQKDFLEIGGRKVVRKEASVIQRWEQAGGSLTHTHQREFRFRHGGVTEGEEVWRWKRSLSRLIPDESGLGYIGESGIIFDITEEREMKNALIRARYDAEAASRAKSDFLARMSHEIRTPMNAIIGMSHLTLRTQLNAAQRDYQNKIRGAAQSLMRIIDDILDFSKIEAGKMALEKVPFRLDEVLGSIADVTLLKAQEKQLEVIFSVSAQTPQWLVGDPLRLGQVLTNLTSNAVKFTPSGEILVRVDASEERDRQIQLHFSVTDSGIGLNPEQIDALFQPFSQADGSITRKFGGTGLGLAICKNLVEMMGGRIWVTSEPGKGSTFHFSAQMEAAPDQAGQLSLPIDLRGLRTLIVDDNATALESHAEMVASIFSAPPETAGSAIQAMEKIRAAKSLGQGFDLILLDWRMPGTDGIEACRRIKEESATEETAPRLVLMGSTYDLEQARSNAILAGIEAFLTKPVCASSLFDTVAELWGRSAGRKTPASIEVSPEQLEQVRGTRILVVEDNPFNQQVTTEFLQQAGMEVAVAENGAAALRAVAEREFDLVFMDIQMPDLDGLEVSRRIRNQKDAQTLPIVAMTAHALKEDREKSLAAGMNDHITKPIDPQELMSMLVKYGNKRMLDRGGAPLPAAGPTFRDADLIPYRFCEIDAEEGLRRCLGNSRSYLRFLKMFGRQYQDFLRRCEAARASGSQEALAFLAHAIKGPAGSIGARTLYERAALLEKAINCDPDKDIQALYGDFSRALQAVLEELGPILEAADVPPTVPQADEGKPSSDLAQGEVLLEWLEAFLKKNDARAGSLLPELRRALAGEGWEERLMALQTQIWEFDFDEALATLEELGNQLESRKNAADETGKSAHSYC